MRIPWNVFKGFWEKKRTRRSITGIAGLIFIFPYLSCYGLDLLGNIFHPFLRVSITVTYFQRAISCSITQSACHCPDKIINSLRRTKKSLRCIGTPSISGKPFTGFSAGRTAALCIIVIQTGVKTHTHTPTTRWARAPCFFLEKRYSVTQNWTGVASIRRRALGITCCPVKVRSVISFSGYCPCVLNFAVLFWCGSHKLLDSFTLQRRPWRQRGRGPARGQWEPRTRQRWAEEC